MMSCSRWQHKATLEARISKLNSELVDYFIQEQNKLGQKSYQTLRNLERDLVRFVEFLDGAEISADSVKSYINKIEDNYMESSFLSKLSSLRQFVNWLNLKENPFWHTQIRAEASFDNFYEEADIFKDIQDEYDDIVISFIYEFYLSIDELMALNITDYNTATGELSYRGAKLAASEELKKKIKYYFQELRPVLNLNSPVSLNDPFFINEKNQRTSNFYLRKKVSKYGLRPLYVKKSRIVNLLTEGLTFEQIEAKLAIKVTKLYRPFLQEPEYRLLKAYNDFHPRASK